MTSENRDYYTIAQNAESRTDIKGSEFISRCFQVQDTKTAMEIIKKIRQQHADATHNCWAYRINANEYRFNDDGEPGGTAGQPILQAIIGMELEQVCIIVTRYYGGTKLGAGGLARAYGGGAAAVLKLAGKMLVRPKLNLSFTVPFTEQSNLYHFLSQQKDLVVLDTQYSTEGVTFIVEIFLDDRDLLTKNLINLVRNQIKFHE